MSIARLVATAALALPMAAGVVRAKTSTGEFLCENWRVESGLPANTVYAITQTSEGYLWLGTRRGLARFDGVSFTVFHRSNTPELPGHSVSALAVGRDGTLFIGFEHGGFARRRQGAFRMIASPAQLPAVQALALAPGGDLWLATRDGLYRWTSWEGLVKKNLPGEPTAYHAVAVDQQGRIYAGTTSAGVLEIGPAGHRLFSPSGTRRPAYTAEIYADPRGAVLVGTDEGAIELRNGAASPVQLPVERPLQIVRAFARDSGGTLWIGAWNRLFRSSADRVEPVTLLPGEPGNQVLALFPDREGALWVGTEDDGLFRLAQPRVSAFTRADGLAHNSVKTVMEDARGRVWIGTDDGVSVLQRGRISTPAGMARLAHLYVRSIQELPSGTLWFGTNRGLFRWDGRVLHQADQLAVASVFVLARGSDSTVWVGHGGITQMKNGAASVTLPGSPGTQYRAIIEDRAGRVWASNGVAGLQVFDRGRIRHLTTSSGLSSNEIASLYEDSSGAVWAGTQFDGLNRVHGSTIQPFSRASGFHDGVYQILEDNAGYLWLGGGLGIHRVRRADLERHLAGGPPPPVATFGAVDGMPSLECTSGQQPGAWKSRDGRLWFSTIQGVVSIDPRQPIAASAAPPVIVESILVDGVSSEAGATFGPGAGTAEIRYTALSLRDGPKTTFRYRLRGHSDSWTEAGNRRTAYFTGLKPGDYKFELAATAGGAEWSAVPASLTFTLKPHFYQTGWFLGACAGVAALAAGGAYRYRVARVRAHYNTVLGERNRLAREIHDTLMQGVAGISAHLEAISVLLQASPTKAVERLDRLRVLTRGVVEESRRRIWDLRSADLERGGLAAAIQFAAERAVADSQIRLSVSVEGRTGALPPAVEENLLQIAREAVSNAVRHSGATAIVLRLSYARRAVNLTVSDNGRGLTDKPADDHPHFGILGMKERAESLSGDLEIDSAPGRGTTVSAHVPVRLL